MGAASCYNKYKHKKSILEGLNNERPDNNRPFGEREEAAEQAAHEAEHSPAADASASIGFLHRFQIRAYGRAGDSV